MNQHHTFPSQDVEDGDGQPFWDGSGKDTDSAAVIANNPLSSRVVGIDLGMCPGSPLAISVAQIAQGIFGTAISDRGVGTAKLNINRDLSMNQNRLTDLATPYMSNDAVRKCDLDILKTNLEWYCIEEVRRQVLEHYNSNHRKPKFTENSLEELKHKVSTFSLFTKDNL